jgi:eukaryotic-like serine/threonine-protein kinase
MRVLRDIIGETLSDRYRVVSRIAGGGMGEVYRGHDLLLDRSVAVKILQHTLADDPELVDRFRLEARAAAKLLHPNVVTVYDWGAEDDRTYYMVMEYVSGTDLRDVLVGRGALEPAQAVEVMTSVCDALAAAHDKGLVHRDVKPENVLISDSGVTKVADFGIAVVADADRTSPGIVPGTLRYLSPEQAGGSHATFASDIWAAGAVLAECLTGRPPLQGSGPDLLRRRAEDPPLPPSSIESSIHPDLDAIVLKACALDPADRWPHASDMAAELRRAAARSVSSAPPVASLVDDVKVEELPEIEPTTRVARAAARRRRRRPRLPLKRILLAALVVAAAIVGISWLTGPVMVDVPSLLRMSKSEATQRLSELGLEADVVWRRDKFEERGEILDQSPLAGRTLEEGSVVSLTLSSGPPQVTLPSLIGMSVHDAEQTLTEDDRGLVLGEVKQEFSLKEEGTVIAYEPSDNRIAWGSTVDLTVSKGPEQLEVPDVSGMGEDKAVARINDSGFAAGTGGYYSDDVAAGIVIGTSPAAGEIVPEGGEVEVQVSIGPEFEEVRLPDVRNMSIDNARAELESLGLRVQVVRASTCSTVSETDPISGTIVHENDVIALFC